MGVSLRALGQLPFFGTPNRLPFLPLTEGIWGRATGRSTFHGTLGRRDVRWEGNLLGPSLSSFGQPRLDLASKTTTNHLDSQVAAFFSHCCWFWGKVYGKK